MQQFLPRIVLALVFAAGAVFASIESEYYRSHTITLAEKSGPVVEWMWVFRGIAVILFALTCVLIISLVKK